MGKIINSKYDAWQIGDGDYIRRKDDITMNYEKRRRIRLTERTTIVFGSCAILIALIFVLVMI